MTEAARLLAVAKAYDGAENVNSAYGHLIDDFKWTDMSKLFGKHGAKEVPFAGYYAGFERLTHAVFLEYGDTQTSGRAGIAFHWLIQPVIHVASDGRSARAHSYLFHPDTNKRPGSASLFGAMYPDNQFVLEDGVWRFWNLSLDEPYFELVGGWKGGWSGKAAPRAAGAPPPAPGYTPCEPRRDPTLFRCPTGGKVRARRTDHGTGESGRALSRGHRGDVGLAADPADVVELQEPGERAEAGEFPPDCIPCDYAPDSSMTRHGYLLPPTGPEAK